MSIDKESLVFAFNIAAKNTIAEKAILEIIEIPGEGVCNFCKKAVKIARYYDACPSCGHFSIKITQGEALQLSYMEIE